MSQSNFIVFGEIRKKIISRIAVYPYLIMFIICLTANALCLGSEGNTPQNSLYIEALFIFMITAVFGKILVKKYVNTAVGAVKNKKISFNVNAVLMFIYATVITYAAYCYNKSAYKGIWLFCAGTLLLLAVCVLLYDNGLKMQVVSLAIIGESFLIKFYYIFYTSVYMRQNDVGEFGGVQGHYGYIEYILFNHKLPDFDPREVWSFCHPPLHHFLSAVWIGINQYVLGIDLNAARESLQTLTLFYSMVVIMASYQILRYFKLKGAALYIPLAIIAFHPSFTYLAGSVNNDILSIALMMYAVVCTMKWYEKQTMGNILKIAFSIGFAMMTKLSSGLVAPSVAIVFLYVFIKKGKGNFKKYITQFICFSAVCVPLGMWFEIKNLILYKMPVTYVQEVEKGVPQDLSNQSFISRITDFSTKHFTSVFEQWLSVDGDGKITGFNDNNPIITLFKNSLFGEYVNESTFGKNTFAMNLCKPYFWLCVLLAALFLIMMIRVIFRKKGMQFIWKAFFGVFYFVIMVNIYKMSEDYPMVCTMNFRYITPTVIISALFCGIWLSSYCGKNEKENRSQNVEKSIETNMEIRENTVKNNSSKTQFGVFGSVLLALTMIYAAAGTFIWIVICYNTRG